MVIASGFVLVAMTSCGLCRDPLPPAAKSSYAVGDYKISPNDNDMDDPTQNLFLTPGDTVMVP